MACSKRNQGTWFIGQHWVAELHLLPSNSSTMRDEVGVEPSPAFCRRKQVHDLPGRSSRISSAALVAEPVTLQA